MTPRPAPARRGALGAALGAAALLGASALVVATPAPGLAAEGPDCLQVSAETTDAAAVTGAAEANDELTVPAATRQLRREGVRAAGEGVGVVVVDTPVGTLAAGAPSTATSPHGLIAASIVAGPDQPDPPLSVGIAPAAQIFDRPFYTAPRDAAAKGELVPTTDNLVRVLRDVAREAAGGAFGKRVIVLVPAEVPGSPALSDVLAALGRAGVLVVAAGGDRPAEGDQFPAGLGGAPKPGENAGGLIWPAADPGVLAVGATAAEAPLRSSDIDLGAPGAGAVARAADGRWCVVATPSSHWAAAQVAGVAALVWSGHPGDDAATVRARLQDTAAGSAGAESLVFGFGQVQALEALERGVVPTTGVDAAPVQRALAPRERVDVLADQREQVVVWGIVGGAAMCVLALLRPVLARRRSTR